MKYLGILIMMISLCYGYTKHKHNEQVGIYGFSIGFLIFLFL